jgi:hypothetical protein
MTKMRDVKAMMKGVGFRPVQTGGITRTVITVKCSRPGCLEQHEVMQGRQRHPAEFLIRTLTNHGWTHSRGLYFCPAHKE